MKEKRTKKEKKEQGGWKLQRKGEKQMILFRTIFFQLICKDSLIFKSNLELALSIILKERELYESKHVAVECRCLKI